MKGSIIRNRTHLIDDLDIRIVRTYGLYELIRICKEPFATSTDSDRMFRYLFTALSCRGEAHPPIDEGMVELIPIDVNLNVGKTFTNVRVQKLKNISSLAGSIVTLAPICQKDDVNKVLA